MLSPESRVVAMELLKPPMGYCLDKAVLTTYSLDLDVLLALPLAVLAQSEESVEQLLEDPLLLLEGIREAGKRIQVFVDETGIAIPTNSRALYGALEASVHPVKAPNGGAFHPKVWIARFLGERQPPLIRVSVASRNLTFDRSWDIALTSEAVSGKRKLKTSKPLADFLRRLPELGSGQLCDTVLADIHRLAEEVHRTGFPSPDGFSEEIEFHVLGLKRKARSWVPMEKARRVLAISPFISSKVLQKIACVASEESLLISRSDELAYLTEDLSDYWNNVYVLQELAEEESEDEMPTGYSGLHAKIMIFEKGHQATWFIGSANLTNAAFRGSNVEVMASVSGPKGRPGGQRGVGIDQFFESGFLKLCEEHQQVEYILDTDKDLQVAEKLEQVRSMLLSAELQVGCSGMEKEWQLAVRGDVAIPEGVSVNVWPLSIEEHQAKPWAHGVNWSLPISRLTAFFAFDLKFIGHDASLRFAIKLPATGMPESRMHHVLRTLIDSPERFLQFLRALLGGLEENGISGGKKAGNSGKSPRNKGLHGEPLLEDMLRAAASDSQRLIPIRRLITDLRESEEGRKIVTDELYALWQVVDSVIAEREKFS